MDKTRPQLVTDYARTLFYGLPGRYNKHLQVLPPQDITTLGEPDIKELVKKLVTTAQQRPRSNGSGKLYKRKPATKGGRRNERKIQQYVLKEILSTRRDKGWSIKMVGPTVGCGVFATREWKRCDCKDPTFNCLDHAAIPGLEMDQVGRPIKSREQHRKIQHESMTTHTVNPEHIGLDPDDQSSMTHFVHGSGTYINHACTWCANAVWEASRTVTIRDIAVGDQILVNYEPDGEYTAGFVCPGPSNAVPCPLAPYNKMTNTKLKAKLRKIGKVVKGNKRELAFRLFACEHQPPA